MRKYNPQHANPEETSKEDPPSPSSGFPPGTRYPPTLPDPLAHKPRSLRGPVRKKPSSSPSLDAPTQSKPPPSLKDVEKALSRLPPLLPKFAHQNVKPDQIVHSVSKKQKFKCRAKSANSAGKTQVAINKVTNSSAQNQGKLIITLPTAPVTSSVETQITVPRAATIGPSQGNVFMTLATALICPIPSATLVAQTPSSFTPLVKEHTSQRCETLLKLSMGQRPTLNPLSVSSQLFLLPPGCVVTNGADVGLDHSQTPGVALENFPESMSVSQADSGNDVQEHDETETDVHEEELECGDEVSREPFLTLSESSGSPAPSLSGESRDGEAEDVEEQNVTSPAPVTSEPCSPELQVSNARPTAEQRFEARRKLDKQLVPNDISYFSFGKETVEKLAKLASDPDEKRLSREEKPDGRATGWP